MKYRKKPVVIEAILYTGENKDQIFDFTGGNASLMSTNGIVQAMTIGTLEGRHIVSDGDYVIKGVKGEFYPCKPDIFELTYDVVE